MVVKNLMDLQNTLKEYGILINFSGRLSQGIIQELGDAVKSHMEAEDRPKNDIYSVFGIFIEETQNITNYSSSKEKSKNYDIISNSGIVSIGRCNEEYFVWSGNLIENQDIDKLVEKIQRIIDLDKNELKKLYREEMKKQILPGSKSAGLGLIDIARKASKPIEYSIEQKDEEFSFFIIKVLV